MLTLPLAGALAQPSVPGATTSIYATVTDPFGISFGADGALYLGRDNSGSGGGNPDAVKIHRVGPGGSPVTEFGNAAIPDPDVVVVDRSGLVSGLAGAVLVGGQTSPGVGQVSRIAPDGTVSVLFGPASEYWNPSGLAFDSLGRLLFADAAGGRVYRSDGSTPVLLFNLADAYSIAADAGDRIVVSPANTPGRLMLYTASGTLSNASFANVRLATPMALGPGGFWTTDLYAITESGGLIRIAIDGMPTTMGSGFSAIEGLVFGPDGALYASDFNGDRVWRIAPVKAPPGLSGLWAAEGHFLDSIGTNHGVSGGGVTFTNGRSGLAFRFVNSANSTIQLPNSPVWQPANNQFTIEAWVKPDFTSPNVIDTILEQRDGCSNRYSFIFSILKAYPGYPPGVFGLGMLPQISYHYSTNRIPDDGQFHHVAVTYNGNKPSGNCALYLDGRIVGGGDGPGTLSPSTVGPIIGVHRCLSANSSMTLDELGFYNRELAPGEIAAIYRASGSKDTDFIPSGLISWWRGENDTGDALGTHPGTPVGSLAYAPGPMGQAFSLNGQNAAVALGNWFNLQAFTLGLWVNIRSSQVQHADILDNNHTDFRGWVIQSANQTSGETSRWVWGANGAGGIYYWMTNGTWQHLVVTVSSNHTSRLYLDGQLVHAITGTGPIAYDGTQNLNLGRHQLLSRYFNGMVDELMVFDRPLTDAEVTSLYVNQGGRPKLEIESTFPGVVLLSWPLGATAYRLEATTDLAAGSWETVTNTVVSDGSRNTVPLEKSGTARFFRLKSGN